MPSWVKLAVAVAVPGAAIFLVVVVALWVSCRRRQTLPGTDVDGRLPTNTVPTKESLQAGIARLRRSYGADAGAGLSFQHLNGHDHGRCRQQQHQQCCQLHRVKGGSDFSWGNNSLLVAEAGEGGWSRFAFLGRSDSSPRSASLLGSCVACDAGRQRPEAEVGWEVPMGSSDYVQTVRLKPGGGGAPVLDGDSCYSTARMSLPLPGPPLGGDPPSFPQEAYFEITILHLQRRPPQQPQHRHHLRWSKRVKDSSVEGDRRKLIARNPAAILSGEGGGEQSNEEKSKDADATICLGLTRGGSPSEKPPGSYPGSIGFHSDGSVWLDGIKLVFESDKGRWGTVNRVVGCGFDPGKRTVFFTMDAVLLHVVHCNSDAFRSPLYPVLGADADALVSVNLGQVAFRYSPANAQRTPNPCFLRPAPADPSARIGYDDSRELFSMGRIDSQWLAVTRKTQLNNGKSRGTGSQGDGGGDGDGASVGVDIDAESDLFEISLNR